MKRATVFARVACLAIFFGTPALSDSYNDRLTAAHQLLKTANEDALMQTRIELIVRQNVQQYKEANPSVDSGLYARALHNALEKDAQTMLDMRARYYANRLSLTDIQAWTRMLETPVGHKIVLSTPDMMSALYAADTLWVRNAISVAQQNVQNIKSGSSKL